MSASAQPTFAGTRCLPIEDYFHRIPLVPWICPPLHPELLRLLENIGQESVLAPGVAAEGTKCSTNGKSEAPCFGV